MRSRDAWLAVFAAALGVSEEACKRDVKDAVVHDAPSASASAVAMVAATAPSASAEPTPALSAPASASASAAPSASAPAAHATAKPTTDPAELARAIAIADAVNHSPNTIGTGTIGLGHMNASCGASASCGATVQRHSPIANVSTNVSNGAAGDERVVASMRPRLRACVNQGLQQDPSMHGKVVLRVSIAANGEVTSSSVAQNNGLSDGTAQCMARALRNSTFEARSGSARSIDVTVLAQPN
jgi:hypothetical protein